MIEYDGDDAILSFDDWDGPMMFLANQFADLPTRPGFTGRRTEYALGIDRLQNDEQGRDRSAISLLRGVDVAATFEFCPDAEEVVEAGRALIKMQCEVDELYRVRGRNRR